MAGFVPGFLRSGEVTNQDVENINPWRIGIAQLWAGFFCPQHVDLTRTWGCLKIGYPQIQLFVIVYPLVDIQKTINNGDL